MKKEVSSIIISTVLMARFASPVFAANTTSIGAGLVRDLNVAPKEASRTATISQKRLQDIITKANAMIADRLNALNKSLTRVSGDNRLTDAEKASLTADIQTNISGLTSLKAKIDDDTDVTTALADAKTIVTTYRIYLVFEPKMNLLITLNNLQKPVATLQGITPQIQTLINNLQSQGKDVSGLTPLLSDINTQLQTISGLINKDITTVSAITPATPGGESTLAQMRNDIKKNIMPDFNKIHTDVNQMRTIFKTLNTTKTSTSTSSATTHP